MRKLCLDITFHVKFVENIEEDDSKIPNGYFELPAAAIKSTERELENMFIDEETVSSDIQCIIHRSEVVEL